MAENTLFTDEELEKMLANFEWQSDEESSEVEEYYAVAPWTINTKVTSVRVLLCKLVGVLPL